jgi:(2Fe-2S) ferredoxin
MNPVDAGFSKMGIDTAQRHVFLCIGPDCCSEEQGMQSWEVLKERIKQLGIPVLRSKAGCFRICCEGPWMAIYPEGIWYGGVTPEKCHRIIEEHLLRNAPIQDWIVREHCLSNQNQEIIP